MIVRPQCLFCGQPTKAGAYHRVEILDQPDVLTLYLCDVCWQREIATHGTDPVAVRRWMQEEAGARVRRGDELPTGNIFQRAALSDGREILAGLDETDAPSARFRG